MTGGACSADAWRKGDAMNRDAGSDVLKVADEVDQEVVSLAIDSLRLDSSPRVVGVNSDHVQLLADTGSVPPPIIVHRLTMRVIDGVHRVRAAQLLGLQEIAARFYDGEESDAFVLAVTLNAAHGLPLSLADRTAAAARIVSTHPHWSDRRIATVTGLSGATVGAVRGRASDQNAQSNARVGRDGRARPVSTVEGRMRASKLLTNRPELSLREIAKLAGVAPSTVRDVRQRLAQGENPVPLRQRAAVAAEGRKGSGEQRPSGALASTVSRRDSAMDRASALQRLRNDPSLRFNEAGRALLRWLDQHPMEQTGLGRIVDYVPAHWAGSVAELIRGNAEAWTEFALELEQRAAAMDKETRTG